MATETSIIYGYGTKISNSKKISEFIDKHKESILELRNKTKNDIYIDIINFVSEIKDHEKAYKTFEYYEALSTCIEGLNGIIADVMAQETGISFEYRREQDVDDEYIYFPECMPWQLSETEKELTESKLDEMIERYLGELEIPYTGEYIKLEYYG